MKIILKCKRLYISDLHFSLKKIQIRTQRETRKDNWLRLGLFTGSIALNAIGDGLNHSGNKDLGHICNALSIGVTLSIPLFIEVNKENYIKNMQLLFRREINE